MPSTSINGGTKGGITTQNRSFDTNQKDGQLIACGNNVMNHATMNRYSRRAHALNDQGEEGKAIKFLTRVLHNLSCPSPPVKPSSCNAVILNAISAPSTSLSRQLSLLPISQPFP
jgi:hypothetical protein